MSLLKGTVLIFFICVFLPFLGCRESSSSDQREPTAPQEMSLAKSVSPEKEPKPPTQRPNVLLLTIDTLRADHLSSYGYPRQTSPNIDALAKEGVLFKNAMCNWPKTTPSFASMLTGTYGRTNRVKGGCRQKLSLSFTTLAEVMLEKGYRTGAVVNNGNLGVEYQFNQGFQDYVEIWKKPQPGDCVTVTDDALTWLKENHASNFFLWVHYISPHAPYRPAPPYGKMFVEDDVYKNFPDRTLKVSKSYHDAIHVKNAYLEPHQNLAYYISQYDGEIAHVDSQVKRIFDSLRALGLSENTLVIVSSDHGEELGEHRRYFEHGKNVYQTTMHVPLIMRLPGTLPAGKLIEDNLTLVDLYPTVLDYAGIKPGDYLEGQSLRRFIESNGGDAKLSIVFSEGGYMNKKTRKYHSVAYWENWKLIHANSGAWALYDLRNDPSEQNEIKDNHVEIVENLKNKLTIWESKEKSPVVEDSTVVEHISEETKKQLKVLGYMD